MNVAATAPHGPLLVQPTMFGIDRAGVEAAKERRGFVPGLVTTVATGGTGAALVAATISEHSVGVLRGSLVGLGVIGTTASIGAGIGVGMAREGSSPVRNAAIGAGISTGVVSGAAFAFAKALDSSTGAMSGTLLATAAGVAVGAGVGWIAGELTD